MSRCPKCEKKLTKRKKIKEYHCVYHGFVRRINSETMLTRPIKVLTPPT